MLNIYIIQLHYTTQIQNTKQMYEYTKTQNVKNILHMNNIMLLTIPMMILSSGRLVMFQRIHNAP